MMVILQKKFHRLPWKETKDDIISTCLKALGKVINNHYTFSPCPAADRLKQNWRYREYDYTRRDYEKISVN